MLDIPDGAAFARALGSSIGEPTKSLLRLRRNQLLHGAGDSDIGALAHFIIVEPGDAIPLIQAAAGYPVVTANAFEWVADHGGLFEAVTITSDDGFAVVLIVRDDLTIDAGLLGLLRVQAAPADADDTTPPDQERSEGA